MALLAELPDSSFAFSDHEIGDLPHLGGDLFRALPLLPGVTSNDVAAGFSVHAGRRDEIGVRLDGQEIYDPYHLKDYDGALSIVPSGVLAAAELSTGALPASRGDRMGGVLDLTTAEPPAERHFTFGLSALDLAASGSGRLADGRLGWLAVVRRGSLDVAAKAIGDEHPRFWDALAKVERRGERGGVAAHFLAAGDELEFLKLDGDDRETLATGYDSRYGWVTWDALAGNDLWVETLASWASVRRDRGGAASEEEGTFGLRDRRDLEVLSVEQSWSWQAAPRHALSWGGQGRRYEAFFAYDKDLEPEFELLAPYAPPPQTLTRFRATLEGEHYALWASDRFGAGGFTAEVGLRWDHHTATGDELWSPRLAFAWKLGERSLARASWGRFQQSQRPYELLVEDGETTLAPAESSDHWQLGYETLFAANPLGLDALRLEGYRRRTDDPRHRYQTLLEPLNFFPEIEPGRVLIDAEETTVQGIELLLRGHRGPAFDWWLTYAWSEAEDRFADDVAAGMGRRTAPRSLDQPHALSLVLHRRLGSGWDATLAWRYHSGWPITPVELRFVPVEDGGEDGGGDGEAGEDGGGDGGAGEGEGGDGEAGEAETRLEGTFGALNSRRLGLYHRLDLRLSRSWSLSRGRLTFFLDVQNVYDRENLAGYDVLVDDEGESARLAEEGWPGIFPSLGIVWEF